MWFVSEVWKMYGKMRPITLGFSNQGFRLEVQGAAVKRIRHNCSSEELLALADAGASGCNPRVAFLLGSYSKTMHRSGRMVVTRGGSLS